MAREIGPFFLSGGGDVLRVFDRESGGIALYRPHVRSGTTRARTQ
jgi:hypothetical protein